MLKIKPESSTVPTPKGKATGANPIDGLQATTLEIFNNNPHIPKKVKETPHQLYFDLIWVVTQGSGTHYIDFEPYQYKVGSVFIIKKGQFHAWELKSNVKGFMLFFTDGYHAKMGLNINNTLINADSSKLVNPYLHIAREKRNTYFNLLTAVNQEFTDSKDPNKVLSSLINAVLTKLEYDYLDANPSFKQNKKLLLFQEFQKQMATQIPLSRNGLFYANKIGSSFKILNEACKLISGHTLKVYIDMVIITRAKQGLSEKKSNVSEVAFSLGFDEVGNFCKFFKSHTALTPKEFIALI